MIWKNLVRQSNSRKAGFTLVELLVVIAIIGVLVALLLPAVQAAREAARRSSCANNTKQIGLALHNYHDTFNVFPPAGMLRVAGNIPMNATTTGYGLPWGAHILPFIEQGTLYQNINLTIDWQSSGNAGIWGTKVKAFQCPSDPNTNVPYTDSNGSWARGCYGANFGIYNSGNGTTYNAQDSSRRGVLGFQQSANMAGITDGTSNTVLIWELRAGPATTDARGTWGIARFGGNIVSGCDNWGDCYGINEGNHDNGDDMAGCSNAKNQGMGCYSGGDGQGGSKSKHPGGVHGLMGDASTRFVNQSIDFGAVNDQNSRGPGRQISTASGGEAISGDF